MNDAEIRRRILEVLERKVASPTLEIAALSGLRIDETKNGLSVLEKEGKVVIKNRATTDDLSNEIVILHREPPKIRTGDWLVALFWIVLFVVCYLFMRR